MDERRRVRISKRLSYHLRHDPAAAGVELDAAGWADLGALVRSLDDVRTDEILAVVRGDPRRFELSVDGARVRARYGHSVAVDPAHGYATPPATLYHGTARKHLARIHAEGIDPRGRRKVHLSASVAEAVAVGRRHGSPVVLRIDAARMRADGVRFSRASDGVWLVGRVAPSYLEEH